MAEDGDAVGDTAEHEALTADRVEALIRVSQSVVASNIDLSAAARLQSLAMIDSQERARLARRRFLVTVGILSGIAAMLLTGLITIVVIVLKANSNAADSRFASRALLAQISGCLTPSTDPKSCYVRNQKQTAGLLGQLNANEEKISACAPDYVSLALPERYNAIAACVTGLK